MQPSTRLPHLVRGSSAAAIATFAALFAHVLGGGEVPGFAGVAVPFVLSLMVCVLLAGRTLSLTRLSVSVIASQTLFHTLFVLGTQPPAAGGSGSAHAGHHGHMMPWVPTPTSETMALVQADAVMWGSHLAGALITIAFLYRGERALDRLRDCAARLARWLERRLVSPVQVPALPRRPRRYVCEPAGWSVLEQMRVSTLSRRGPPVVAAVA